MNIVLGLKHNPLLITTKFMQAKYLTVFVPEEVKIFDGEKATIASSMAPIL